MSRTSSIPSTASSRCTARRGASPRRRPGPASPPSSASTTCPSCPASATTPRPSPSSRSAASFELQPDHAHQAVGHLPVALDLVAVGDQHLRVPEIEEAAVDAGQDLGGDLLVDRLAAGLVADPARLLVQRIDLGVAVLAVVQRRFAGLDDVGVAVGIGAAAPTE